MVYGLARAGGISTLVLAAACGARTDPLELLGLAGGTAQTPEYPADPGARKPTAEAGAARKVDAGSDQPPPCGAADPSAPLLLGEGPIFGNAEVAAGGPCSFGFVWTPYGGTFNEGQVLLATAEVRGGVWSLSAPVTVAESTSAAGMFAGGVVWDGADYIVAWSVTPRQPNAENKLVMQRVTADGTLVGPPVTTDLPTGYGGVHLIAATATTVRVLIWDGAALLSASRHAYTATLDADGKVLVPASDLTPDAAGGTVAEGVYAGPPLGPSSNLFLWSDSDAVRMTTFNDDGELTAPVDTVLPVSLLAGPRDGVVMGALTVSQSTGKPPQAYFGAGVPKPASLVVGIANGSPGAFQAGYTNVAGIPGLDSNIPPSLAVIRREQTDVVGVLTEGKNGNLTGLFLSLVVDGVTTSSTVVAPFTDPIYFRLAGGGSSFGILFAEGNQLEFTVRTPP